MDPVSNIIINSCWYHMAFPLRNQVKNLDLPNLTPPAPWCFDENAHLCSLPLPYCIIDTRSMARLAIRSLDGLIAALCDGASMSLLQALEFLTTTDCDISRALLHPTVFAHAAKAAKHPQYGDLGSFLSNLLYQDDKFILYGLPQSQLDSYPMVTQHLCKILPGISLHKEDQAAPLCKLTPNAAGKIINRKYFVREMLCFLGAKLDKVLHEYHYQHPWEPSFQLDVICGVNEPSPDGSLHHVNFLASSCGAEAVSGRTLFFAELWHESMPGKSSSCSPLYDYIECIGRCSFCEKKRSKIIHPPSGGYFGDLDGSLDSDGSHGWLDSEDKSSEGLLLTDYVYFDPARDHDLGQALNHFHG